MLYLIINVWNKCLDWLIDWLIIGWRHWAVLVPQVVPSSGLIICVRVYANQRNPDAIVILAQSGANVGSLRSASLEFTPISRIRTKKPLGFPPKACFVQNIYMSIKTVSSSLSSSEPHATGTWYPLPWCPTPALMSHTSLNSFRAGARLHFIS